MTKCWCNPIGRGSRLKIGSVGVQIPLPAPNISVKVTRPRLTRVQSIKSIAGIALTLILTSTVQWPNIMLEVEPVTLAPMIEAWPLDDSINPWLNNAK